MTMKKNIILLLLLILGVGCEKETNIIFPDAIIIKELPKLYILSSSTESVVIQSLEELYTMFGESELQRYAELQQVDFSKQTLLLGFCRYGNLVSAMRHYFVKTGERSYTYLLKISGNATMPDAFWYGIVVAKLPKEAEVSFKIESAL